MSIAHQRRRLANASDRATTAISPLGRILARLEGAPPLARVALTAGALALQAGDFMRAEAQARMALGQAAPLAHRLIGLAREKAGESPRAFEAYREAHSLAPTDPDTARDLARMANRLGHPSLAIELLIRVRQVVPDDLADALELGALLRDQDRYDEALAVVREALRRAPEAAAVWSLLGSIASHQGDDQEARAFHDQAMLLDPISPAILANAAIARLDVGDALGAIEACDTALAHAPTPAQAAVIRMTRAQARLLAGDLPGGWDDYAARLAPERPESLAFDLPWPRLEPDEPLEGLNLLLIGEQGLGDEVMFGGLIGDLIAALGPGGRLTLAVEPRLVSLFARSWPGVRVFGHVSAVLAGRLTRTIPDLFDPEIQAWAPMADLPPRLRPALDAFTAGPFLRPAPARAAHWRVWLEGLPAGDKVGVLWKSLKMTGPRTRRFAPFEAWRPVLATPGKTFVSLQYGEAHEELAFAAERWGVALVEPPGLDLTHDLEGVAALCAALDGVIGPPTATTNLSAAVGAPTWMIYAHPAWPTLGTGRHPWYPSARAFTPDGEADWSRRMARVGQALSKA
ncbi:tetratricopeptide repeat protein [Caulobacter sp. BP25]|uniref:tetratricopeptide repeat protein n=1 Tax=Caulobacter sp. BP25 TaxID=2048900 RepID=UPI0013747AA9|nr:tetratricopeptide repeat protein [Caulobacter sp. BP25]